jgi:hypothetical protein
VDTHGPHVHDRVSRGIGSPLAMLLWLHRGTSDRVFRPWKFPTPCWHLDFSCQFPSSSTA